MENIFLRFGIVLAFVLVAFAVHAQVKRVDAIGITVKDMDRSISFYRDVLGFKKISDKELYGDVYEKEKGLFGIRFRLVRMQLGDEFIELTDYLTAGGRSIPEDAKSNDLFFQHIAIVVSDMDRAYHFLRQHNIEHVSTGPQTIPVTNLAAAGVKAFYFHDPDGHNLELIYFPKDKGQEKWQQANGKLFLGIDHTAIGISDTEQSLRFYQSVLGLDKKGESWNFGTEQEHLNFVEGASLHITGLRADAGPGIEFLQYLKPGAGRSYPTDTRADDIWHWQTSLIVDDADKLFTSLKNSDVQILSKEPIQLSDGNALYKAFIVRDPDGHALQILQKI